MAATRSPARNFRINGFPQLTIDPVTDALYGTWADDRNGSYDPSTGASIKSNGDVFIIGSCDGGRSWSATYQVGTAADEVYPAVAAYADSIAVTFYTRTYDANGIGLDYAYAAAHHRLAALAHAHVRRVTTQTSDPSIQFVGIGAVTGLTLQGEFIGDYTAAAMGADGVLHPYWTDFRGNPGMTGPNQDAYSRAIRLGEDD